MKYTKTAVSATILILVAIVLIAYFCFLAFSTSYGYSVQNNKNSSPVGSFPSTEKLTIVIDAGHGGIDPGAIANNLIEKDLNLAVAKKLQDLFSVSDINVILTREDDADLCDAKNGNYKRNDLERRLEIVEGTDNCIFVSIHMNKFDLSSAHGLQTFYSTNNPESLKLAECVQEASKLIDADNNRAVKADKGEIFVLKNTYKPAVLIECGFLSNANDAAKLKDPSYQNLLAFIIYSGILNYLGE